MKKFSVVSYDNRPAPSSRNLRREFCASEKKINFKAKE